MHSFEYLVFIRYTLNTSTDDSRFTYRNFSVLRRFSDFVWLQEHLSDKHPGVIIPPLPPKQFIGRFEAAFIDSRRRGIQRFLVRLSKHPILSRSELFVSFLSSDDSNLQILKQDCAIKRKENGPKISRIIESKMNSMFHFMLRKEEVSLFTLPP